MPSSSIRLLNAVTGTGTGTAVDLGYVASDSSWHMILTGTPTTATCSIEGSLDGINYFTYSTANLTQASVTLFMVDRPIRFVRANLSALTGGTAPTVTVWGALASGS